jgi:hypothetical protein
MLDVKEMFTGLPHHEIRRSVDFLINRARHKHVKNLLESQKIENSSRLLENQQTSSRHFFTNQRGRQF